MSKKTKKKSFFKKVLDLSNNHFRSIYKDIVRESKENSELDLKILEPNIKEAISKIKEEVQKDKDRNKMRKDELVEIVKVSVGNLKEAIKKDKNGMKDEDKAAWIKELEELGLSDDLASILGEDTDDDDFNDDDDFSEESEGSEDTLDLNSCLSADEAKMAIDAAVMVLSQVEDESFKTFIEDKIENISTIIPYSCVKGEDRPVDIQPEDELEVDESANRSMRILCNHISLERTRNLNMELGIEDDQEAEPNIADIVTDTDLVPIVEKEATEFIDEVTISEYKEMITKADEYTTILKSYRSKLTPINLNMLDMSVYVIRTLCNQYFTASERTDITSSISFVTENVQGIREISTIMEDSGSMPLEIYLLTLMNISWF
ncbi:MAG: hypothetical protein ACRC92_27280 [Peptostreptococcaceae bacterium]